MNRLTTLSGQFAHRSNTASSITTPGNPDDVVICAALRTAITKAKRGGFKDTYPEDLLANLLAALLKKTNIDPNRIQDVCIGNVLQPGAGALGTRIGMLMGGLPASVPVNVVNRQCSSGLQAVANIVGAIRGGFIDVGIGGGVESMSHFEMMKTLNPEKLSERVFQDEQARNCLIPMGLTSENVAEKYGISREAQDQLAKETHEKCVKAQEQGLFKEEIVPLRVKVKDANGVEKEVTVDTDEGPRKGTTVADLAKLKPAFQAHGTTTAGNSSQVSDGAALVLLARRSTAEKLRLPILARFVAFTVVGVPPEIMGIGPAFAIPAVLEQASLSMDDIDIFELNEAFASQVVYCVNKLKIPKEKLNPKGGGIALGHPLGCTGARQIATLLPELRRRKLRYGVVSMCVGTGMGAAAIIENLVR
ncbi:putative acetyl-CoA acyltransferase B [Toxoplasma gondii RUB]|uniref:acetyl-CoA C-acyltransferase n=7 Tax=Toxoplasma gondii TaxID=5811 RepID=S7WCG9_TOXGG|nr:putative acetyl-CoA acyltransferase B [Toxoplasma gondii GT1]KAF4642019.1 putative acetyl-CoA acyltransferase B [Toxoplasma gondii]KFG49098.1 putative acetyl-CoA acyltransferase B [Toxoplasma gondii GAB2-2007-GAL-DOM2]KFG50069.1 putative acetyl-CoA acyltransferase B [Toxoplasma gondii FOU]KFG64012.1 putative acetyl-CoA acyltransferase B [Toxoplasma gondii RUB]KFH11598.1 putative acetyl-CoA acyltransferase B [Toxoplasma gondii VAND]PUA92412.1 putative acetyl-CoA acyltransferase B [Toxoplasm